MNFYLIRDLHQNSELVGVLIESREGSVHARLHGTIGPDDANRVVKDLLQRMDARGFPVVEGDGRETRLIKWVRPGEPGFVRAWLRFVSVPLSLVESGEIPSALIDKPSAMTKRLWNSFDPELDDWDMPQNERLI